MKKGIVIFLSLFLLVACSKEHDIVTEEGEFIEVPIALSGISVSINPLTKALYDIKYGFQVYTLQGQQETPYAWGVFIDGIFPTTTIKLKKGTTYKFCSTILNYDNKINTVTI